ncbi:MAG: spore cortex biosynthesis protein YabQ [Tissierellia bacterium]|nr:spore cortex biosynthesis protein YabQ [Tissierellia bacterium]
MDANIRVQLYIFITSIYAGLLIGLIYDLYRVIRYFSRFKKLVTDIGDIFFWLIIALLFFYIMNKSNWAELRGYIFFGTFMGGLIYLKILSKLLYPIMISIFKSIILTLRWLIRIVKFPFIKVNKMIKPKMRRIKKIKAVPWEALREIKRYRKLISKKK